MIAVTGAVGFIGANLALELGRSGRKLLLVDHPFGADKAANFVGLSQFEFVEAERFLQLLDQQVVSPDAIFHLGACSSTTETDWQYLSRNNVEYTQKLWHWCVLHRRPLIYASSAATYGDGSKGFDDETSPSQLLPLNLYGKSKNDFDIWALAQTKTPPFWAGMKFFNVYGPRELHKNRMASVVYHTWNQIKSTGRMKLFQSNDPRFADGEQLRDFVFVGDCIEHMIWLWKSHSDPNGRQTGECGVYNSGTGRARTFLDLAKAVFHALNLTPQIDFIPMPADLHGKYQNYTQATMAKLASQGYQKPPTTLEDGVRQTVAWLEKSPS